MKHRQNQRGYQISEIEIDCILLSKDIAVLLIHIASDQLYMQYSGAETVYIPYQDLEREFPRLFLSYIADKNIETLVLINGPGSFTQLRIACLTLRLYIQSFTDESQAPRRIDIPKCDIYEYRMKQGLVPSKGFVFAGPRKKLFGYISGRDLSLDIQDDEMIDQAGLDAYIGKDYTQYRVEYMTAHQIVNSLDDIYMHSPITLVGDRLECNYMGSRLSVGIEDVGREVDFFEPMYMMEPQIG